MSYNNQEHKIDDFGNLFTPYQILIFALGAVLTCTLVGALIVAMISMMLGLSADQLVPDVLEFGDRMRLRGTLAVSHILTFLAPAMVVALFLFRRSKSAFLGFRKFPISDTLPLALIYMMVAMPVVALSYQLNQQIWLPEWALHLETQSADTLKQFLVMESPLELFVNLFVAAVLPGIGEELIFRGIIQQQLTKKWGRPVLAVCVTAIFFSTIHLQFQGFMPRLFLGLILGALFYWSKNLWYPILAHVFFNGFQITSAYFLKEQLTQAEFSTLPNPTVWAVSISLLAFGLLSFYIRRKLIAQD